MSADQNDIIEELFEALKVSQTLSADIFELLKEENKAIQKMATQSLIRITSQKEELLAKTNYLDKKIAAIIKQYLADNGGEGNKISALLPFIPQEQGQILMQYQKNLSKYRQEIFTRNMINKRFTKDTLQYIDDAISLITNQSAGNHLYGNRGIACYANQKPAMISREV